LLLINTAHNLSHEKEQKRGVGPGNTQLILPGIRRGVSVSSGALLNCAPWPLGARRDAISGAHPHIASGARLRRDPLSHAGYATTRLSDAEKTFRAAGRMGATG
jgi:hypothetical protein